MDVSCIILAGGKSTRLGRNKPWERIGSKSLLERAVSILSFLRSEIIIVTAKDSALPPINNYSRIRIINDIIPGKGSMGGIYTGLQASRSFFNLVVACDMPFLNKELISYMISLTGAYDAVVPRSGEKAFEPLHAIYSKNCLPSIENLIQQNRLSILELLQLVKARYVIDAEIDKYDPKHLSFFNINTESDLQTVLKMVGKEDFWIDKC